LYSIWQEPSNKSFFECTTKTYDKKQMAHGPTATFVQNIQNNNKNKPQKHW